MSKDEDKRDNNHRGGRGNRGGRDGGRGHHQNNKEPVKPRSAEEAVPILKYGPGNNWIEFKKRMAIAATEKYRNLGRITEQETYYIPPEIFFDPDTLNPTNDPFGLNKAAVMEEVKERRKQIERMRDDRPSLYAFILFKLSRESEDELKRYVDYNAFHEQQIPLELWTALKDLHLITTTSKCASVIKQQATEDYMRLRQGDFETLTQFKERFENKLQAYNSAKGNDEPEEESAMQFLSKLCRSRYAQYYAFKMNQINSDETKAPKTLNEIYPEAMTWLSINTTGNKLHNKGASFATGDGLIKRNGKRDPKDGKGKGKNKGEDKDEKGKDTNDKDRDDNKDKSNGVEDWHKDAECFNCNEIGHIARNCPKKNNLSGMTVEDEVYSAKWYEIGLDTMSQVNIVHSRFLKNIRRSPGSFGGLKGVETTTEYEGDLEGFFPVQVCDDCRGSVLCYSDVEQLYEISSQRGESFTVHMPERDVIFYKKDRIYLADFRDWIGGDDAPICLVTTSKNEEKYTKKQVDKAKEVGEFIKNAGFPSEGEAIKLARGGNIDILPITPTDIKLYYEIYGSPVEAVRRKTTASKNVNKSDTYDPVLKEQITIQEMTADTMHAGGKKFLISVSKPLKLTLIAPVPTLGRISLGRALQDHLDVLRTFSFDVRLVRVDPLKALAGLRGSFPGVEIDISGAGDHLPEVDIKIRRVKGIARSVIASLDWNLPKALVNDLITYCVSRINVRTTSALMGQECPRVRLTGRKMDYKKEFKLAFGDYVEARDPDVTSNNITHMRTQPCIALYPTPSINGAWKLLNLTTKMKVSRAIFTKMKSTPKLVINIMNHLAGGEYVTSEQFQDANAQVNETEEADEELIEPVTETHVPDPHVSENLEPEADKEVIEIGLVGNDEETVRVSNTTGYNENDNDVNERNDGLRRSVRANAGTTTRYEGYTLTGVTRGYGLACVIISGKTTSNKYTGAAKQAVIDEVTSLVLTKKH